jgi:hypothetical protein
MKQNSQNLSTNFSELILHHLEKILQSPGFQKSQTLSRFLLYIVQETMNGRSDSIKEYSIGTGVLNKQPNFCPMTDCIVRVHAKRLRDELDNYYQKTGQQDELIISIPKGRYVPLFSMLRHLNVKFKKVPNLKSHTQDANTDEMAVIVFNTNEFQIKQSSFESLSEKNKRQVI